MVRKITEIPDDVDLESDISAFVLYSGDADDLNALKNQAEVFLGQKFGLPSSKQDPSSHHLKIMNSSNPLCP